jgi:hypothetical protein
MHFREKPKDSRPLAEILVVVGGQQAVAGPAERNRQQDDNQKRSQNFSLWIEGSGLQQQREATQSAGTTQARFDAQDIKEGVSPPLVRSRQKFVF